MKLLTIMFISHILILANDVRETNDVNTNYSGLFFGHGIGQYFQFLKPSLSRLISWASAIEFDVTKNGNLDDIKIINSLSLDFDGVVLYGLSKFSLEKSNTMKITNEFRYRLPFKFEN